AALVSLVGPGGVGKTRLAREFGRGDARPHGSEGGVWFCDLTDARSAVDVAACVARALDLGPDASTVDGGTSRLRRAPRHRSRVVVILDNFEQVATHAGVTLRRWLKEAPAARFLVTSREPLGLVEEVRHELTPLTVDDAVALFTARAAAVRPGWTPSADDGAAIAAIVRRLDALPLAIELAAARSGVLTPVGLLPRPRPGADGLRHPPADA